MTLGIRKVWVTVNYLLTIVNATLLAVLTGNVTKPKEIRDTRIPVAANILLLIFLSLGLVATIYSLRT